jgi:microcystin-dependent protein
MPENEIAPKSGNLDVQGIILQNGKPLLVKDTVLVLSQYKVLTSDNIDAILEPKVIGLDISSSAYDITTGLVKAKTLSSLTDQEVLGICVSSTPAGYSIPLIQRGIVSSTLTGVTVGDPVYATSNGKFSLAASSRKIGYVLTTGINAKVFLDIRTENSVARQNIINGAIQTPSGVIFPYLGASAPTGWLLCNGSSQLTATYPNLFSVIGYNYGGSGANFNVPDYRGMFLRGTGSHGTLQTASGSNFSGPALHGNQLDMEQSHKHVDSGHVHPPAAGAGFTVYGSGLSNNGAFFTSVISTTTSGSAVIGTQTADGVNGSPRIGSETRPASYGVNWVIKI